MSAFRFPIPAVLFLAGSVYAQMPDSPPPPVDVMTAIPTGPFKVDTIPRTYFANTADSDNGRIFDNPAAFGVYRTTPKLVAGIHLTRHLALETGYTNLVNRGHHLADYARPDDVAGALGVKGFNSYLAARLALPLGERLRVVGKLGVAHSEYSHAAFVSGPVRSRSATIRETDVGTYTSVGLQYDIGRNAILVGAYERHGDTAQRWGVNTNNNGFSLKLDMRF